MFFLEHILLLAHIFYTRKVDSFFINQICQRQLINDISISKLMDCIVDFESLLSLLQLERDFSKLIENFIYANYDDINDSQHPKSMVDFFNRCLNLIFQVNPKEFFKINKLQLKEYDRNEIDKLFIYEINRLRIDAANAIYRIAQRFPNKIFKVEILDILRSIINKQEDDKYRSEKFIEYVIKIIQLYQSQNDSDFEKFFTDYLLLLKGNVMLLQPSILNSILRFMRDQARDLNRCQ